MSLRAWKPHGGYLPSRRREFEIRDSGERERGEDWDRETMGRMWCSFEIVCQISRRDTKGWIIVCAERVNDFKFDANQFIHPCIFI